MPCVYIHGLVQSCPQDIRPHESQHFWPLLSKKADVVLTYVQISHQFFVNFFLLLESFVNEDVLTGKSVRVIKIEGGYLVSEYIFFFYFDVCFHVHLDEISPQDQLAEFNCVGFNERNF